MSDEGSADLAANSWPGFVDILSAVIIMFVFFVLVTAVALYFHTITYTSTKRVEAEVEADVDQMPLMQMVQELEQENSSLKSQVEGLVKQVKQTEAQFKKSDGDQEIQLEENGMQLIIFYGRDSITLTDETRQVVDSFIQRNLDTHGADRLELLMSATKDKRSPIETVTRKVAIARLMNIRNEFLQTDVDKEAIFVSVTEPTKIKDQYDWAKLEFRLKR